MKVSIIIPVFNTEKYLKRCVDSCLNQTLSNIEIILIDDCSTDSSRDIILDYAKTYPDKVRYIFQKENNRQGASRNRGMEIALGEYYLFVDSDDWIEPDTCDELYNKAKETDADMVGSDYFLSWDDKDKEVNLKWHNDNVGNMTKEKRENLTFVCGMFWARIYSSNFLKKIGLTFPENIYYEDAFFNFYSILFADRIYKIDKNFYHYYQENQSTVRNRNNPHQYEKIKSTEYLYNWGISNNALSGYEYIISYKYLHMQAANLIYTCLGQFDNPNKEKMKSIDRGIREKNLYNSKAVNDISNEFKFFLKLNKFTTNGCIICFKYGLYYKFKIIINKFKKILKR